MIVAIVYIRALSRVRLRISAACGVLIRLGSLATIGDEFAIKVSVARGSTATVNRSGCSALSAVSATCRSAFKGCVGSSSRR